MSPISLFCVELHTLISNVFPHDLHMQFQQQSHYVYGRCLEQHISYNHILGPLFLKVSVKNFRAYLVYISIWNCSKYTRGLRPLFLKQFHLVSCQVVDGKQADLVIGADTIVELDVISALM